MFALGRGCAKMPAGVGKLRLPPNYPLFCASIHADKKNVIAMRASRPPIFGKDLPAVVSRDHCVNPGSGSWRPMPAMSAASRAALQGCALLLADHGFRPPPCDVLLAPCPPTLQQGLATMRVPCRRLQHRNPTGTFS